MHIFSLSNQAAGVSPDICPLSIRRAVVLSTIRPSYTSPSQAAWRAVQEDVPQGEVRGVGRSREDVGSRDVTVLGPLILLSRQDASIEARADVGMVGPVIDVAPASGLVVLAEDEGAELHGARIRSRPVFAA